MPQKDYTRSSKGKITKVGSYDKIKIDSGKDKWKQILV